MKAIKKAIGWFFKIILYPFHILATFFEKYEDIITIIVPGLSLLYAIYTIFVNTYYPFKEGRGVWLSNLIFMSIAAIFILMIVLIINLAIIRVLEIFFNAIDKPYDYLDAWSRGFTYAELKGYQNYENSTKGKSVSDVMNRKFTKIPFVDFEEDQQRVKGERLRREREENRRRVEEERRKQEEENRNQYKTSYDIELEKAYKTLHLKKDCSFDEVKNNYRMLVKMFHPDSNRSNFDTTDVQLEINKAYDFLKKYYNQ